MLDDRESSVKSAKQLADNLLKNLDSREQKAIQNQSAQLQQRWDVLRQNAANRLDKLEDVVGLARDYQEVRDPLCQWLDMTEKKFAALEPSAMDTEGIENIITSLKVSKIILVARHDREKVCCFRTVGNGYWRHRK